MKRKRRKYPPCINTRNGRRKQTQTDKRVADGICFEIQSNSYGFCALYENDGLNFFDL